MKRAVESSIGRRVVEMSGISESCLVPRQVRRAATLLRTEGLTGLVQGMARYVLYLAHLVYWNEYFVIYEIDTANYVLGLDGPAIEGLEVHILHSEHDVNRMVGEGYEDVRLVVGAAARRLQQDAVAFCAFVNREVAHVAWVAFTQDAQSTFDVVAYPVDFDGGEAWWGGSLTTGRFRNLGIYRHVMAWRLRYCHELGYRVLVDATIVGNMPSLRSQDTYNPRIRAFCRYRRLLHWRDWKEL